VQLWSVSFGKGNVYEETAATTATTTPAAAAATATAAVATAGQNVTYFT